MAAPIIPPAHTTASSFSWVGNGMPGIRWKKPNTRGYQKLLTRVVRANRFPSTHSPSKNISGLKQATKASTGIPQSCRATRARPVLPPVIR